MNNIKKAARSWAVFGATFLLLAAASTPAYAFDNVDIESLISALPPGWSAAVTAIFIVLYAVAQLRALMPPALTGKIPSVIMAVLDFVAANWRHARNADAVKKVATDAAQANGPSDQQYRTMVETAKNNGELRNGSRIESAGDHPGADRPGSKNA